MAPIQPPTHKCTASRDPLLHTADCPSFLTCLHSSTAPPPLAAVGLSCIVGLGAVSPGPAFSSMMTKFGLASICGYQTVW